MGSCHSTAMPRAARWSRMNDASLLVSPGGFSLGIWTRREQSSKSSAGRFLNSSMSRDFSMVASQGEAEGAEGRS
jgi:phosphoribosylformylglycinamidine (FGAM) synthase-like amidotransferase family enzyme